MKILVVYESMWGNTEQVARAIATGLGVRHDVEMVSVDAAPVSIGDDIALIVAGGPTHALSMSRRQTRADAAKQGAPPDRTGTGLREWLNALPVGDGMPLLATFDTKIDKARHLPGSAARSAARFGRRHGYRSAARAQSFYVHGTEGPLLDGELDRATAWGRSLGSHLASQGAA